jgi:uncharacterized protein YbaR (Trm112 family)
VQRTRVRERVHRKLLDVLVDPAIGESLSLAHDDGQDVTMEGVLLSPSGSRYSIVGGVPRFVPLANYSESFGLLSNRFAKVEMDSSSGAFSSWS